MKRPPITNNPLLDAVMSMQWFCSRVEAGEVRSVRTYQQFQCILDNIRHSKIPEVAALLDAQDLDITLGG